jgi:predicted phage terminase large subunit-like protein
MLIGGMHDMSDYLHLALCRWFQMQLDAGVMNTLVMIQRGAFKTSVFNICYAAWLLVKNPEERIYLGMVNAEQAGEKLRQIKRIILSDPFRHFFPDMVPKHTTMRGRDDSGSDAIWQTERIILPRVGVYSDPSIKAKGIDSEVTSGHFTTFILDDPIGDKASESIAKISSARGFLESIPGLCDDRRSYKLNIIGTAWPGGFYEDLMEDEDFAKMILGCYVDERFERLIAETGVPKPNEEYIRTRVDPDNQDHAWESGYPTFPERETMATIADAKKKMKGKFPHQMLNIFVDDSQRRFRRSDIRYYTVDGGGQACVLDEIEYPLSPMYRVLTIDPSTGEGDDESAIVVTGFVRSIGVAFVLDVWHGKELPNVVCDRALELASLWRVNVIAPEDTAFQKTFKHTLQDRMVRKGEFFPIIPVKPGHKNKQIRIIDGLQPWVADGYVYFLEDHPGQRDLIEQAINLKLVQDKNGNTQIARPSPDMVDALAYHVEFWKSASGALSKGEVYKTEDAEPKPGRKKPPAPAYGLTCEA